MAQLAHGTITVTDITDITDVYLQYALAVSSATVTNSYSFSQTGERGWNTTVPTWASGYQIWVRQVTEKEGIQGLEYGTPYLDEAINQVNQTANNALSIANGTSEHFWPLPVQETHGSYTFAAGAYVTEAKDTDFIANPVGKSNLLVRSTGVYLNLGLNKLASFESNKMSFYNPSNDSISMMDLTSSGLTFYTSAGGEIGTFGSNGLNMAGSLNIRGGGCIGQDSTNYWEFGDNRSYQDTDSAYLLGKGNASIQLGETGHWRLDKNRIHTGWYQLNDSTRGILHFDTANDTVNGVTNTYYWDYGLNYPNRNGNGNNKFLYIRRSTDTTSTSLATMKGRIDDDTWWTYKFWIDGDGKVHAPGFYIGDSSTPIGGGTGTVAEKLLSGAGSSTKPVYVRSDTVDGINYTGVVAPVSWDVNSSINTSSSTNDSNIATIGAIKTYVTGRGYVTSSGVTSITLTQGTGIVVSNSGTAITGTGTRTISLADNYGDTKNPYASKTKNYVLAAPSNAAGAPTFRLLVASDIPDLSGTYLTSHQTVTNKSATLAWGTSKTVATIGSTDITVSLPSNPNTNTTYSFTGGTNKFTVTPSTGDPYDVTITPSITNNVTGSGTSGSLVKWSGTNTLTDGPAFTSGGTGFLKQDGTWGTPGGTYSLPVAKYNTLGGVKPAYSSTGAATLTTAAATNTTTPTIAAKTTTNGRYYAIETDKNGVLFVNVPWTNVNSSYLTGITSNDVTTALGYTPYNSTNPNGYTTNTGTVTSVRVQASSPLQSSTSTASSTTLNTTISFINQDANKVLAGPSSGNAAAPTFRSLVANDIPSLSWNKITSDKPTTLSGYGITDAAGLNALVGLSASSNAQGITTFTATRASGQNPLSFEVSITASSATGATKLRDSEGDISKGDAANPVYFSGGVPELANTIPKLNNTTTGGTFYAPTTAGNAGYVLKSNGSGAPTWIPQSDISSGNTYTTTIAADNGTNQLTLAHGTKYKLTAGGTNFIFTMPTDTDEKLKVAAVTSGATYYPIVGTGTDAATRQYDTTGFVYTGTNGTANGSNGNALLTLGNSTASTTANWKKGTIRLYGTTAYYIDIVSGAPTANRTITLPNATGTVALTSDLTWNTITSKPTNTGSSITSISIADHGTTSITGVSGSTTASKVTLGTAFTVPNITGVGTASTWSFTDITVPIRADSDTTVPKAATSATTVPKAATSATTVPIKNANSTTVPVVSSNNDATLSFAIDSTDTAQLNITWSATPTRTVFGTAVSIYGVQSSTTSVTGVSGSTSVTGVNGSVTIRGVKTGDNSTTTASKASGSNSTVPTLGTAFTIPNVTGNDSVTVPKAATSATTVVTGKTHSITDNGHTHTI